MVMKFFFGHLWITPVAFLLQSFLLIAIIWFPKSRRPDREYESPPIKHIRGFMFGLFFVFGLIFIDAFVEVVILGSYAPVTWMQTYPSAILGLICGIEYVFMAVLVAPNIKALVVSGMYLVVYLVWMKVWIPISGEIYNVLWGFGLMAGAFLLYLVLHLVEFIMKKVKPGFRGDRRLWNIRPAFKRFFNIPFNVVLLILLIMEGLLSFMGYSLITIFIG